MVACARSLFLRPISRLLASACVSSLHTCGMPAAAVLRPMELRKVARVMAAVTLRWLHGNGECALLATDVGTWAAGLPVPDASLGYANFAEVDASPLPYK